MKERERALAEINKLYLLIHPGFCSHRLNLTETQIQKLFDAYFDIANNLGINEAMVLITHAPFADFKNDLKIGEKYTLFIQSIRSILFQRLIVISGNYDIADNKAMEDVNTVLNNRGFVLSNELQIEVFGEAAGCCVMDGLINFKDYFGIPEQKITVDLSRTDLALNTPDNYPISVDSTIKIAKNIFGLKKVRYRV